MLPSRLKRSTGLIITIRRWLSDSPSELFKVKEINLEKTPITKYLWDKRRNTQSKQSIERTNSQISVIEKIVDDSKLSIRYDFGENALLRETYSDSRGFIMMGKIFEDLDAFAGNIALSHCCDETNISVCDQISLVTASVDKISLMKKTVQVTEDSFILVGQVAWVGNSSLDILMEIHSTNAVLKYSKEGEPILFDNSGSSSRLLSSFYTFAARDRITGHAIKINRLKLNSEMQRALFKVRDEEAIERRKPLEISEPNREVLRQLIEKGSAAEDMPALSHPSSILMKNTSLENTFMCHPQHCNTAGRVFGGFLMHKAYDLAFSTCYTFAGSYPLFRQIDKVAFKKPVDIGDLIRMKSRVVYTTENPLNQVAVVEVTCQIVRPEKQTSTLSNTFTFEFDFHDSVNLRRILPCSNEEANVLMHASTSIGL